jgi:hypothetical protein
MKECCVKWTGDNTYKIEPAEGDKGCWLCKGDINFCPECGSSLTRSKPELPEEFEITMGIYPQPIILNKINALIRYLRLPK